MPDLAWWHDGLMASCSLWFPIVSGLGVLAFVLLLWLQRKGHGSFLTPRQQ